MAQISSAEMGMHGVPRRVSESIFLLMILRTSRKNKVMRKKTLLIMGNSLDLCWVGSELFVVCVSQLLTQGC